MSLTKKIACNTSVVILESLFVVFLNFFFLIALARYLGPENYGTYSFATEFIKLFGVFTSLGLNVLIWKEIPRDRSLSSVYFWNILIIEGLLGIIAIPIILAFIIILGYSEFVVLIILLASIGLVISTLTQLAYAYFLAYEERKYEAVIEIAGMILLVGFGIFAIYFQQNLMTIMLLITFSYLIKSLFAFKVLFKTIPLSSFSFDLSFWPQLIKTALPFAFANVFFTLYFHIDITMISIMKGNAAVGFYTVAYRFITFLQIIPSAAVGALWPVYTQLFISSKDHLSQLYQQTLRHFALISIPIPFGTFFLANNLMILLFGMEYSESTFTLQILIWVGMLIFFTYIGVTILGAIEHQVSSIICLTICTIFNVVLNLFLIPLYSYNGAAIATVITEILLFLLYNYFISRAGIKIKIFDIVLKPILASFIMAIFLFFAQTQIQTLSNVAQIIIIFILGIFFYLAALFMISGISKEDIQIGKKMLRIN